jgi:hypothetical protein
MVSTNYTCLRLRKVVGLRANEQLLDKLSENQAVA